jgi:transposase
LYGLSLGIRSSRKLEDATKNRIDFIWLLSGRVIDHATIANFRVRFGTQIKDLFRQVGKIAIGMGLANLNQIALDGTLKRSSNSRYKTARRASLQ